MNCSFCGKSDQEVRVLLTGPNVWICDECGREVSIQVSRYFAQLVDKKQKPSEEGKATDRVTEECPGGCSHSDEAHRAFDHGLDAGRLCRSQVHCLYRDAGLREAWQAGFSVGHLEYEDRGEE